MCALLKEFTPSNTLVWQVLRDAWTYILGFNVTRNAEKLKLCPIPYPS